jgi:hypothetical protein
MKQSWAQKPEWRKKNVYFKLSVEPKLLYETHPWLHNKVGNYKIHYCLKCFDIKNVEVASWDIEIYYVVQGD